jgi:hypothetical protein
VGVDTAVVRYALILLTHGDAPTLDHCLDSYAEMVTLAPVRRIAVIDGDASARQPSAWAEGLWQGRVLGEQLGFCRATAEAWAIAADTTDADYIFWLEHDFVFNIDVDLSQLARTLQQDPLLAQISLRRQAITPEEIAAGGLVERYARVGLMEEVTSIDGRRWVEHNEYWTTNPSLFRRSLAVEQPWPDGPECEGKFGLQLREAGYRFAVWGALEGGPWVTHAGVRSGHGY